jgi:hypothetical protein
MVDIDSRYRDVKGSLKLISGSSEYTTFAYSSLA